MTERSKEDLCNSINSDFERIEKEINKNVNYLTNNNEKENQDLLENIYAEIYNYLHDLREGSQEILKCSDELKGNDEYFKIKTINYNNILGLKKSKTANINYINIDNDNDTVDIGFSCISKNLYTYSFLGIEIPEIKTNSTNYFLQNNVSLKLYDNTILYVNDIENTIYYIFDLYLGKIKYPNIDITLTNFIFSQIFGIFFGILLNKIIN